MKSLLENLDLAVFGLAFITLIAVVLTGLGTGTEVSQPALDRAETAHEGLSDVLAQDRFGRTELSDDLTGLTSATAGLRAEWNEGPRAQDMAAGLFYCTDSVEDLIDGQSLEIRFFSPRTITLEPRVGGILVSWEPNAQSTVEHSGYLLYRKSGENKSQLLATLGEDAREYLDRAVQPGMLYSYEIAAQSTDPVLVRLKKTESARSRAAHARPKRDYEVTLLDWIPAEKRARVMIRKFSGGVWHEKEFDAREGSDLGQEDPGSGVDYRTNCHIQKITSGAEFSQETRMEVLFDANGQVLFADDGQPRRQESTYTRERQVVTLEYRNELGQKEKLILKR